jgi:hypothetical protein
MRTVFWVIAAQIRSLTPQADITRVMQDVERLLDQSIMRQATRSPEQAATNRDWASLNPSTIPAGSST